MYVFSTKNRVAAIREDMQARLWAYMGGIARSNNMKALAVGGIADHCHILLSLPPTITVAKAIQLVKSGSSKWMHDETASRRFEWHILNQPRHHKKIRFDDEWKIILKRHADFMDED